jgi:hypothetical protein
MQNAPGSRRVREEGNTVDLTETLNGPWGRRLRDMICASNH